MHYVSIGVTCIVSHSHRSSYTDFIDSNFIAPCAWFQSAYILRRSHGYQYSPMLHLLLYIVMWQLTTCFQSSKLTQIGPCMLMSLSIHLHGSHLDVQYGQTWHLSTQVLSGERTGHQLLWSSLQCNWPYYLTTRFLSPSSHMVSAQSFLDRPCPMLCKSAQMGSCPIIFLWLWPATDHEPHSRHVPTNKLWRRTETTPWSRWWCSYVAGINSNHSTHKMNTEVLELSSLFIIGGYFLILWQIYT